MTHDAPTFGPALSAAAGNDLPHDRMLTCRQVEYVTGLGRSTIYGLIGRKSFPRPIHIGRYSRWSARSIDRWIEQQLPAAE